MNNLKNLVFAATALLFSSTAFAIDGSPEASHEQLRNEIAKKFININFDNIDVGEEITIKVQFLINDENEIIVLRTDNRQLDGMVKARLNYKEIKAKDVSHNSLYSVNIRLVG